MADQVTTLNFPNYTPEQVAEATEALKRIFADAQEAPTLRNRIAALEAKLAEARKLLSRVLSCGLDEGTARQEKIAGDLAQSIANYLADAAIKGEGK